MEAAQYCDLGFSVIPARPNKKPYLDSWEPYMDKPASKETVSGWFTQWPDAMIGLVTGKVSGLCALDIDTAEGEKAASAYIPADMRIPTTQTPKGGKHLYFKMPPGGLGNSVRRIIGCDSRADRGYIIAPDSINEDGKQYSFLPGLSLFTLDPPDMPQSLIAALTAPQTKTITQPATELFGEGRRDSDLFHTAYVMRRGGATTEEMWVVLERLIISWGEKPDPAWIREKVNSAIKFAENKSSNISKDVRDYINLTDGYFSLTDLYTNLHLLTKREKNAVYVEINRLKKDKTIEPLGKKSGTYRKIDDECNDIDFINSDDSYIDWYWPHEIEDLVGLQYGNLIVVAGEPDSGKTAFLLNCVEKNMHQHKIVYFSSEMGGSEFKVRLKKFNRPLKSWNFTPKERSDSFPDVIKPGYVNIIDFLEIHEDFWRMGALLRDIWLKVQNNNSVAIVAIQKNKGCEYGLGQGRSLEKARMYFSMQPGSTKIIKAKNWLTEQSPNGLYKTWKLVQGCKFIDDGCGWMTTTPF